MKSSFISVFFGKEGCLNNYVSNTPTKYTYKKGKAIPLQAWTGPEGSRRLMLPDFKTIGT